jgi:peptidoglycan hydrolase-like amidase
VRRRKASRHRGATVVAAGAVTIAIVVACRTLPPKPPAAAKGSFSVEAFVPTPLVRVGILTNLPHVQVTADSGVVVWVRGTGAALRAVPMPSVNFRRGSPSSGGVIADGAGAEVDLAYVVPARQSESLRVDSVPYRGIVEVRGDEEALTVVNVVHIEDYLRGVVPNELSPQAFPQIEALKAQAVAARTYALRNRGQFQVKGFDLCATAACQVYKGVASEDPLSDEAIEETRGIAATYNGDPIDALYTSTCGGHTEDGSNIFDGQDAPYLRGVVCAPEKSAWSLVRTTASTESLGEEGASLNRDAALLIALGILEPKAYATPFLKGPASEGEIRSWTARLIAAARRKGCDSTAEGPLTRRGALFAHLVSSLCWDERAERLLSPDDPDFLLQVADRDALSGRGEGAAAALLIQEGLLTPFADGTLGADRTPTRGEAVSLLARAAEKAGTPALVTADFRGADGDQVKVQPGDSSAVSLTLDPQVRLFRSLDGARAAAAQLRLAAGDRVSYVTQGGRVTFLEVVQSRLGAAADHTSRYFRWETRLTPTEVAKGVARYGSVGKVRDVVPRRIGSSGRVVELGVVGTDGDVTLRGLKIRWALGLRDNLFVVDRELADEGGVGHFVFTGKGWGHGVGLCQVGAYGMARAGALHEAILTHYYPGIAVEKVY